ncbi:MAG: hypothetical protein RL181_1542 [Bacteroidota bacterium]
MRKATTFLFFLLPWLTYAQAPVSNLYLFDMHRRGDTLFAFSKPRFLTGFNANGYNNHPSFFSEDEIYFSSQAPGEDQPDIRVIHLRDSTCRKITDTYEGEYSPRGSSYDFSTFHLVRMEFPGRDTLIRLWQVPANPEFQMLMARPVFQDLTNVGYYEWVRPGLVALHLNGSPNQLALAVPETSSVIPMAQQVGRCFKMVPGSGQLVYLQKNFSKGHKLMRVDLGAYTGEKIPEPRPLVAPIPEREDFAVLNDGTLLMASGSRLFKFKPETDADWVLLSDFSEYQIYQITRIEVNPDNSRIILVY